MAILSPASPWRAIGPANQATWTAELERKSSPLLPEARETWGAAGDHSALCLAMMAKESQFGTVSSIPRANRNAMSIALGWSGGGHLWAAYPTWAAGIHDWRLRLLAARGPYAGTVSIRDLLDVYAPPTDGNDTDEYARFVAEYAGRYRGGGPMPEPMPGRVPHPPHTRAIIWKDEGFGQNDLGPRSNRGVVFHRTVGRSIRGTGQYFKGPVGALTQYGIGAPPPGAAGEDGLILMWADPRSRVSPWASGPWEHGSSKGEAFVARFGVSGINRDLIAIEVSGLYDDPISDKTVGAVAGITAYWADQAGVTAADYPSTPWGLPFWYVHSDFQSHKPCPGAVMLAALTRIEATTRSILTRYQGAAPPPVPPPPPESWPGLPETMPVALLRERFPLADPDGPITREYVRHCARRGWWPRFERIVPTADGGRRAEFEGGLLVFASADGRAWLARDGKDEEPATTPAGG